MLSHHCHIKHYIYSNKQLDLIVHIYGKSWEISCVLVNIADKTPILPFTKCHLRPDHIMVYVVAIRGCKVRNKPPSSCRTKYHLRPDHMMVYVVAIRGCAVRNKPPSSCRTKCRLRPDHMMVYVVAIRG